MWRGLSIVLLLAACVEDAAAPDALAPDASVDAPAGPDASCLANTDAAASAPAISTGIGPVIDSESTIAADGRGRVLAAWIAYDTSSQSNIGFADSSDDGATYLPPQEILAPGGRVSADPVLAMSNDGHAYLAWLGWFRPSMNPVSDPHVYFAAIDAANTVQTPQPLSADGATVDKPWLIVDNAGRIVAFWTQVDGGTTFSIKSAVSTDGTTFTIANVATGAGSHGNDAFACIDRLGGANAPLFVVNRRGTNVLVHRSTDGAATWTPLPQAASDAAIEPPTCAVRGSDLWVAYAAGGTAVGTNQTQPGDDVRVVHLMDAGTMWSAPRPVSSGGQVLLPQLAIAPCGTLGVVWYQGAVDGPATLEFAQSENGTAWTGGTLTSTGTFTIDRGRPTWLGDYFGLAAAGRSFYLVFGNNASGRTRADAMRIPLP
jgi:hypothetical protein